MPARGISPATVFKAYYLLEAEGLIRAAPRSGYYVNPRPSDRRLPEPKPSRPKAAGISVDTQDLVYDIVASLKQRSGVPLGSPFIDPTLFPLERLRQSLAAACADSTPGARSPICRRATPSSAARSPALSADGVEVAERGHRASPTARSRP